MTELRNGFLLVASVQDDFIQSANYAAGSIKDNYPDAHITLVVPLAMRDKADESVFDLIISRTQT